MKPLATLRERHPMVHAIIHGIVRQECANACLLLGASPVMAENPSEVQAFTAGADALYLNLGNQTEERARAMLLAAEKAAERGIPVTVDIAGCGASSARRAQVHALCERGKLAVLKGNASEIRALSEDRNTIRGVDGVGVEAEEATQLAVAALRFAKVVVVSGKTDVVTDGKRRSLIAAGHPAMQRVTGTGCLGSFLVALFSVMGAYEGARTGVLATGLAGERAIRRMTENGLGMGYYYNEYLSALDTLTDEELTDRSKWEESYV